MTQPEALRLADALECYEFDVVEHGQQAAAELRRLVAEHEEDQRVIAVWRGRTQRAEAQRDALLEALKESTPSMPPVDAPCHYGIVPQEKCGHCGRIAKARAAIKAVEGENT